ncbi:nucleotidyltransferase domain-containing protein [Actinoplanes oblitus]|uniref:Nucleotidyltransferase domain-containing protein n=1 Tax=Actinoplanes oblitus TaxID=3040509 RepID=A0ABY8W8M0_9ACTN|nr:nucleotidyltransferase domain-containing protein [Actinoplanes oblitus]WIM94211.1 nucleotidyltransferase domain-containing protein [Actinoplanes oblitus]
MKAVDEFGDRLAAAGWVSDLLVAGSLATGDYVPGVSDLDLVAIVPAEPGPARIARAHAGVDPTLNLGCVYVVADRLADPAAEHPTWTHGRLVRRILSGVTRAELVRHGYPVFGRPPAQLLPPMTGDDIRAAARAELTGYWAWAARRPWIFLDPALADLSLTSMARGRHALRHGTLLTKSRAVEAAAAPPWLVAQLRARRRGTPAHSPRLRTAWLAWRDARRTVTAARRPAT